MLRSQSNHSRSDLAEMLYLTAYLAESKEGDNRKHVQRIQRYVFILALGSGQSHERAQDIALASILHDVGKVSLADELLKKQGDYSQAELKQIEQHTIVGRQALSDHTQAVLHMAAEIAYTHHERWDGSGYPQKLKGAEIPYAGRVCAIADVFDALTTKRSYKEPIGVDEAFRLISDSSGVMFDPELVLVMNKHKGEFRSVLQQLG